MFEWNWELKLGLAGLVSSILFTGRFIWRAATQQRVPAVWIIGLIVLAILSIATILVSQILKLSFGGSWRGSPTAHLKRRE